MTNKRTTKRALLLSVLALVLAITMLMGTTYAWFTDSVSSVNNIIKSGSLDVELEYLKDGEWEPVNSQTNVFKENTHFATSLRVVSQRSSHSKNTLSATTTAVHANTSAVSTKFLAAAI